MSMHSDPENFDRLCRLIALKRHEEPPPGYFHHFSRQVIARIRAGERAASDSALGLLWDSWMQRVWAVFDGRPVLAGSIGVACCSLLVATVVLFDGNADTNSAGTAAPQVVEASIGFTDHSSHGSFFEPAALVDFQLTNNFTSSRQGSLFPVVQPVNFIKGN